MINGSQLTKTNLTSVIGHSESLGPLWSEPVERQPQYRQVRPQMLTLTTIKMTRLKKLVRIDSNDLKEGIKHKR